MCDVETNSGRVGRQHLAKVLAETCHTIAVLSAVRHHSQIAMFDVAAFCDTFLHVLNFTKMSKMIRFEWIISLLFFWFGRRWTLVFRNRVAVNHENNYAKNTCRTKSENKGSKAKTLNMTTLTLPWKKARNASVGFKMVIFFICLKNVSRS